MSSPVPRRRTARTWWTASAVVALTSAASCTRNAPPNPGTERTEMSDIGSVDPEEATSFADLPGVDGFEELAPALQAGVLARANHARCDCGCLGHSVNACLHQDEICDVARSIAAGFVMDASTLALVAPERITGATDFASEAEASSETGATGATGATEMAATGETGETGEGESGGGAGSEVATTPIGASAATGPSASSGPAVPPSGAGGPGP